MKHTLQSQRGETIVEVLVSFLLLMIFTSMFVVSLRYARAMSQRPSRCGRQPMPSALGCTRPITRPPNGRRNRMGWSSPLAITMNLR